VEIVGLLDKVQAASGRRTADRVKIALSGYFTFLQDKGLAHVNPTRDLRSRDTGKGRERFLTEAELRIVWHASAPLEDFGRIVRLLILTGQRCGEIGGLLWTEVNLDARQIELPGTRTKNKRPHSVPLSDLALAQLPERREGYPHLFGSRPGSRFGGWSKGKALLDAGIGGMAHWTLHDLRRTYDTHSNELTLAEPWIVEAVMNHVSGHKAGVAGRYNRAAYAVQKRAALERWAGELARIVGGGA
jgi:integrase